MSLAAFAHDLIDRYAPDVERSRRRPCWTRCGATLRDVDAAAVPVPLFDGPGLGEVMAAATARNITGVTP